MAEPLLFDVRHVGRSASGDELVIAGTISAGRLVAGDRVQVVDHGIALPFFYIDRVDMITVDGEVLPAIVVDDPLVAPAVEPGQALRSASDTAEHELTVRGPRHAYAVAIWSAAPGVFVLIGALATQAAGFIFASIALAPVSMWATAYNIAFGSAVARYDGDQLVVRNVFSTIRLDAEDITAVEWRSHRLRWPLALARGDSSSNAAVVCTSTRSVPILATRAMPSTMKSVIASQTEGKGHAKLQAIRAYQQWLRQHPARG